MKGYKNTTKTVYETESSANYAKGGKAMAKVGKVMGEFKSGALHSGSKKGPMVKSTKQAIAIGLSEARKAGAKIPLRKAEGGKVKDKSYDPYGDYVTSLTNSRIDAARAERARKHKGEDFPDVLEPAEYIAESEDLRRKGAKLGYRPETIRKAADAIKREGVAKGDEVYQRLKKMYATRGYAEGGKVKAPPPKARSDVDYTYRPNPAAESIEPKKKSPIGGEMKKAARAYDPVRDEPTSRPLTADQVRNIQNRMKASTPKRDADWYMRNETAMPNKFKKGGYVEKGSGEVYKSKAAMAKHEAKESPAKERSEHRQAGGLMGERETAAKAMVGKAKGGAASAVHKHERNMHPGKPLTKLRNGGKVGC